MRTFGKAAMLSAAFLIGAAITANAELASNSLALPEIVVHPNPQQGWYYDPYTSGRAQRPSSLHHIPFQHYKVPAGYDAAVAMHPYTSGLGPCTEGASPAQGCRHPTGDPIPPSHYERPPFNQ